MRTPRTPRARYCQRSGTSQPIPLPVPPLTTPSGPCLRSTTSAMRRSWSINMTGPSDRWIMHGQRSNQCMGRLIGLTRPTAIVINKEARIQCFYRMSVVNCSQLYKSSLNYSKIQLHRKFKKKIKLSMTKKNRIQIESPAR